MHRILSLIFLVGMLGCGSQMPQLAPHALGEPVLSHPITLPTPDPARYETAAWSQFQRRDYVRALRLAYRAVDIAPTDPSPVFLAAMIYDRGFDRPDLALVEYERMFNLFNDYPILTPLRPRLFYLYRVAQQRMVLSALKSSQSVPMTDKSFAIFPFNTYPNNHMNTAISLGLADLLLFDLVSARDSKGMPPLQLHLLHLTFKQTFPDKSASDFAKWVGADHTLTGDMVQTKDHRVRLTAKLLDASGSLVHTFSPVESSLNDLTEFRQTVFDTLSQILNTLPTEPQKLIATPLSILLHGQALEAYLSDDILTATTVEQGALFLDASSPLIQHWYHWMLTDYAGSLTDANLTTIYQKLSVQPNPKSASQRRLLATHQSLLPATGIEGEEPLNPYKPPQPENTP